MVSEREGRSPVIGLLSHNAPSLRARLQFDMFGLCNYCLGQPSIAFERGQSGKSERTATSEGVENRRGGEPGLGYREVWALWERGTKQESRGPPLWGAWRSSCGLEGHLGWIVKNEKSPPECPSSGGHRALPWETAS